MIRLTGWASIAFLAVAGHAQVLSNQYLTGKYYFRQIAVGTDSKGGVVTPQSLSGTLTFSGTGTFDFGTYTVDPAGFVVMDSPLQKGKKLNARIGPEALIGSSTESTDTTYALFVAIPAPTKAPAFTGTYWTATLAFPAKNSIFGLTPTGGKFAVFLVNGYAASIAAGARQTQQVTGATYVVNADGTGTFSFGAGSSILGSNWNVFVSNSGNFILGGSGNDILIGVKSVTGATNATWNGDYWGAGLRVDATDAAPVSEYSGSVAARGLGFVTWSRRYKGFGAGAFDFSGVNKYNLNANGSGTAELAQIG